MAYPLNRSGPKCTRRAQIGRQSTRLLRTSALGDDLKAPVRSVRAHADLLHRNSESHPGLLPRQPIQIEPLLLFQWLRSLVEILTLAMLQWFSMGA